MKVFIDTNVLVSAVATRGLCADVLREVLSFHELLVSEHLFSELRRVLVEKIGTPAEIADDLEELLRRDSILVASLTVPLIDIADKDDLPIVGAAFSGNADILVTGDRELLALQRVEHLRILSPRQFWEELRASYGVTAS